jgi:hypothetical protein
MGIKGHVTRIEHEEERDIKWVHTDPDAHGVSEGIPFLFPPNTERWEKILDHAAEHQHVIEVEWGGPVEARKIKKVTVWY